MNFATIKEAGEMTVFPDSATNTSGHKHPELVARSGHGEANVGVFLDHFGRNFEKEIGTFLSRESSQKKHEFFRKRFLRTVAGDGGDAVVNGDHFVRVSPVVLDTNLAGVAAHCNDEVGFPHYCFFDLGDPAPGSGPGPVVTEGMDVEDKWLAGVSFDFQASQTRHPVMSVNEVEAHSVCDFSC